MGWGWGERISEERVRGRCDDCCRLQPEIDVVKAGRGTPQQALRPVNGNSILPEQRATVVRNYPRNSQERRTAVRTRLGLAQQRIERMWRGKGLAEKCSRLVSGLERIAQEGAGTLCCPCAGQPRRTAVEP